MKYYIGHHVYGLGAITFGLVTLVWHSFNNWHQIRVFGNLPYEDTLAVIAGTIELLGGIAIQWQRTMRLGVIILGSIFLLFALLWIPLIIKNPLVYDHWGSFFEQFSIVSGAMIIYATTIKGDAEKATMIARIGYKCFGICVISFTLEQLFYLSGTASLVPSWIPPGQMFWAVITTIAFALAAFAILSGYSALLASQLLTIMIVGFGLLIWIPAPFHNAHLLLNWAANAENLAIAGAAWIVVDFLYQSKKDSQRLLLINTAVEQK